MVFSFFKKKDAEPQKPEQKQPRIVQPKRADGSEVPPAATPEAHSPADGLSLDFTTMGQNTISSARIDVVESSEIISPAMEEAAICYANDQVDDAIAILAADLETVEGHHAFDTWLMLFDLYQMQGKRIEFEELALQFVVEFERSAPIWQDLGDPAKSSKKPQQAKAGGPFFQFPSVLGAENIETQLDQLEKLAAAGPVRVEFGKIVALDSSAAHAMLVRYAKFKKAKYKFQVSGATQFAALLQSRIEIMRRIDDEAPFWLLLMEVYQMLGLQEDFENTAVDYAVTFEVSPPSWDVATKAKTAAEVAAEEAKYQAEQAEAFESPPTDGYVFNGPIVAATEATFAGLHDYAADRMEVRIDFSRVPRVDFVSCGMLMNELVALTAQSKPIEIVGANELIVALFRIMGIAEVAKVVRKK
ncbi:STAS domain-containing protein [Chitinimonas lacunae]|uniref:STAS domain-containing protein n=1 Tax=Chitinimonas lacunae TaxID=1963018 RepID=A0ABV8MUJ2_9NEIS